MLDTKHEKTLQNKKVFPTLQKSENKTKIVNDLKTLGIQKLVMFDELTLNWNNWKCEKLTLAILPRHEHVQENTQEIKNVLTKTGLTNKKNYYSTHINITDEIVQTIQWVQYYPERNLIISLINPFADKKVLDITLASIMGHKPKRLSLEEISMKKLTSILTSNLQKQIRNTKHKIQTTQENIKLYINRYKESLETIQIKKVTINGYKQLLKNVSTTLQEQLTQTKKLPFIKSIKVNDGKIDMNFGKIYITSKIRTGIKKVDGINKPVIETKKVFIGDLTFHIGQKITISNDNNIHSEDDYDGNSSYEHPHAKDGHVCFGEEELNATKLLHDFKLKKLAQLLYAWSHSYNKQDAYKTVEDFYEENGC